MITGAYFQVQHRTLLLDLLALNTITPMETQKPSQIPQAMQQYVTFSESIGGILRRRVVPDSLDIMHPMAPQKVKEAYTKLGHDFSESQPSCLLEFGNPQGRSIMFNFHMDTVDGFIPPRLEADRIVGRGAIDAKGLGVAALAGIQRALENIEGNKPRVLVQAVSGEEGGAMGFYGTRLLSNREETGRLNIVLEPTSGFFMDQCTASMTAEVSVAGCGATDDRSEIGDNATLILSYLANYISLHLSPECKKHRVRFCLAGVHTGRMHNRVYGEGSLLMNLIYQSAREASQIKSRVAECFAEGVQEFKRTYGGLEPFVETAANIENTARLFWLKEGLPVLNNRDATMESAVLCPSGIDRFVERLSTEETFTCDAIWLNASNSHTVVFGEGELGANHAHADEEYITFQQLETTAQKVSGIIRNFHNLTERQSCSR